MVARPKFLLSSSLSQKIELLAYFDMFNKSEFKIIIACNSLT